MNHDSANGLTPTSPATRTSPRIDRVVVALVHPSNYDHNEGRGVGSFVQTYLRGIIPSNTLRLLQSLTLEAFAQSPFTGIKTEIHTFDDSIRSHQRRLRKLLSQFPKRGTRLVLGLVAVQSNQFPRALDLIASARRRGAISVIGGPHVTASINTDLYGISVIDPMRAGVSCAKKMPPEIQQLIDDPSVIVFHGDADNAGAWAGVLKDIYEGVAKPYYEAGMASDLGAPGSLYEADLLDVYASPVAAVDTERGCPFKCKFCAAIQAHGRTVRSRDPLAVIDWIRRQCVSYGKPLAVLFASDNLARNPHWRALLAGLKEVRAEGHDFSIWAEADVRCNSGPNKGFLEAYAAAGGRGLFLGIESMNPANIIAAGKKQNDVEELPRFFAECRSHGIAPEGGYIIGFPADTPQTIAADVQRLVDAGLARAWFFVKTLLPGSEDWAEAKAAGKKVSADLNDYDSARVMYEHEIMTADEWTAAYDNAVKTFYNPRNMISVLTQYVDAAHRWRLVKGMMWCRWAYLTEKAHPMIAGLYRFRPFRERRPGQPALSFARYAASETWRHLRYIGCLLREFYIFQHVILEAEWRVKYAGKYAKMQADIRSKMDKKRLMLEGELRGLGDWLDRTFRAPMRRAWLNRFWKNYGSQKWRLLNPLNLKWHVNMVPHAVTEVIYTLRFSFLFTRGILREQ